MEGAGGDAQRTFTLLGVMKPQRSNVTFRVDGPGGPRILKLYRSRRGPLGDLLEGLSQRWVEGKSGVSAAARRATEAALLELWGREGFDVPRRIDEPLPDGMGPLGLWMEYCPGPTLAEVLRDEGAPWSERLELVRRTAAEIGRRQERALERGEVRLIQEHATLDHWIVCGERLVTIDHEGAYGAGTDVAAAVALELAGTLRSLEKHTRSRFEEALAEFVGGHGRPGILRAAAERAVHGGGLGGRLRRLRDRRSRGARGKTWVMGQLLEASSRPESGGGLRSGDADARPGVGRLAGDA